MRGKTTTIALFWFAGLLGAAIRGEASLLGDSVDVRLNLGTPVTVVVAAGPVELANAGPTLGAAGPAPRWDIDLDAAKIRIDFESGPADYGAGSSFTFSDLDPTLCSGVAGIVSSVTIATNKPVNELDFTGLLTFTPSSVRIQYASNVTTRWYNGQFIELTLQFAPVDGFADCNANGVTDQCDIATGAAQDANGNGVPDSCEQTTGCPSPQVSIFTAGVQDGYAVLHPASPSPQLQALLGPNRRQFDDPGFNRKFGHTFTNLPPNIVSAHLVMRARPSTSGSNDSMALELGSGSTFASSHSLAALSGTPWTNPTHDTTFPALNLAALPPGSVNILPGLADGALDVYVQDDTEVDYLLLRVSHCPPKPCLPAPWGLGAWWPLDETSGTVSADVAGQHDGTQVNGPTPVPGMVAGALSFDGVDDHVQVPDPPYGLDVGTGDFSIDFWIKTTESAGVATVIDKRSQPASALGYSVFLFNGNVGLQLADGNGASFCSSNPAGSACTNYNSTAFVADGQWHFVAVTVDRDQPQGIRFYRDGVLAGTGDPTIRPGALDNAAPLLIAGHSFNGGGAFAGELDEIEIFLRRVLGPGDVTELFAAGQDGKCKLGVHVGWDTPFCLGQQTALVYPQVCNRSTQPQSYHVSFTGLAPSVLGCQVAGPTAYQIQPPDTLPLLVAPGSCRTLNVLVDRPAGFTANGQQACFQVTAQNTATGQAAIAYGSVWDQSNVCAVRGGPSIVDLPFDQARSFPFELTNTSGGTRTLRYRFDAVASDMDPANEAVSLDGRPAGGTVDGEVTIPPGQTRQVAVEARMVSFQPVSTQDILLIDRDNGSVLQSTGLRSFTTGCTADATTLCLNGGRFEVVVAWKDFAGNTGVGQAVPLTGDTGYFWFFGPQNVELVLKVLDGRPLNDHFWVFYGALSTVEYAITVTDTETGNSKTFFNPSGNLASVADTSALPGSATGAAAGEAQEDAAAAAVAAAEMAALLSALGPASPDAAVSIPLPSAQLEAAPLTACTTTSTALCLNGARFRVEVTWKDFAGNTGVGQAVPLTGDTGYFWFFGPQNVELVLKVLDGTSLNDHWWVFYGALSSVEYRVTVSDTVTGNAKTYVNPSGNLGSVADTAALPE